MNCLVAIDQVFPGLGSKRSGGLVIPSSNVVHVIRASISVDTIIEDDGLVQLACKTGRNRKSSRATSNDENILELTC